MVVATHREGAADGFAMFRWDRPDLKACWQRAPLVLAAAVEDALLGGPGGQRRATAVRLRKERTLPCKQRGLLVAG